MKQFLVFILNTVLVSCAPAPTPQSVPASTSTFIQFTPALTHVAPSATFTPVFPTPTSTPEVCDPSRADYCITDGHFIFQRPIKPPANTSVDATYPYASTANGKRDPHHGVEFLNKFGTPVYAAGDGIVLFAGSDTAAVYSPWPNYYGNLIVIGHADNLYTLYAHLSKSTVIAGQNVLAGAPIGEVGQSGVAIGSHLHFEVRRGEVEEYFSTQNPELWLVPNQDQTGSPFGVLQIAVVDGANHLIKRAEYTLQYFAEPDQPSGTIYYGVTYSADMLTGEENAVIGDLPPGKYRIALQYNGQHFERWVEVKSGRLTQVVFTVK